MKLFDEIQRDFQNLSEKVGKYIDDENNHIINRLNLFKNYTMYHLEDIEIEEFPLKYKDILNLIKPYFENIYKGLSDDSDNFFYKDVNILDEFEDYLTFENYNKLTDLCIKHRILYVIVKNKYYE